MFERFEIGITLTGCAEKTIEEDINNMLIDTKLPLLYLSSYETLVVDNIGIDVEYNAELKSYEVILIVERGYSNHICIIDCNAHYLEVTIYDYDGYIIESGVIKFGREYIQNYNRFIEEIEFSLGPYGYYSLDVEITCFQGM